VIGDVLYMERENN